jgi:hypothetical protein
MSIAYNTSIVRDGLVLHLDAANVKSYPGSGTIWKDLSGNGNDGTLVNGVGYNADNKGTMVFDGVNDYSVFNAVNSLNFTTQFWVKFYKFVSGNSGYATISNASSTNNGYMIYQSTNSPYNRIKVFVCTPSLVPLDTTSTLLVNTWYNVAVKYDGNNISISINSILDNSIPQTGNVTTNPGQLVIGRVGYSSSYFNGEIANIQIYNRALSESEITQNFEATRGRYSI